MADTLLPPPSSPQAIRWTRDDCAKLERAGFLTEAYELVEGSINRMGQNMLHAGLVMIILEWLIGVFGRTNVVTQASIDVQPEDIPTNEPMPDAVVLTRPSCDFSARPRPFEIRLLVEVSVTTLEYDMTTKARLYARAGIVEYWVISLPDRAVTVHRDPQGAIYRDLRTYHENELVAPLAAPETRVTVSQLLPPSES